MFVRKSIIAADLKVVSKHGNETVSDSHNRSNPDDLWALEQVSSVFQLFVIQKKVSTVSVH